MILTRIKTKMTKINFKTLKPYLPLALISAWVLILYFKTLAFDFVYLDDNAIILNNQPFLADWSNFWQIFKTDVFQTPIGAGDYYRPLFNLSFFLNYQLAGPNAWIYHLTNLIFHLIAIWLLWEFLKVLKIKKPTTILLTAVFAVHPSLVEAVAWIPGRNDTLLAIFFLAAMITFLHSYQKKRLLGQLIFFTLALLTKESALVIPILIILYLALFDRKYLKTAYFGKLIFGWILIIVGWLILRHQTLGTGSFDFNIALKSIFTNLPAFLVYLGKFILPFNFSVLPIQADSTLIWGAIAICLIIIGLIFSKRTNWRMMVWGAGWFIILLLPNLIWLDRQNNDFLILDHRLYLPAVGLLLILMEVNGLKNFSPSSSQITVAILVLIFLSGLNYLFSQNFSDRLTFWQSAVFHSPSSSLAHKNLGAIYYLEGKLDEAENESKKAIEIKPNEIMAHNNLGLIYFQKQQFDLAEANFLKEIKINPNYDNALFNLGLLYYAQGKIDQAQSFWQQTLKVNPNYIDAQNNLEILNSQKFSH